MFSLFSEELEGMSDSMYAMYHSKTPQTIQEKVLDSFGEKDGLVRIVFATNALGMGVNIQISKGLFIMVFRGILKSTSKK